MFLVTADAVWREATGNGFVLDVRPDPEALLGHRVHGARAAPISAVMLHVLEAIDRTAGPDGLLVNDLARVAKEAMPEPVPVLSAEAAVAPSPARGADAVRRSLAVPVALAVLACGGAARVSQYGDAP